MYEINSYSKHFVYLTNLEFIQFTKFSQFNYTKREHENVVTLKM